MVAAGLQGVFAVVAGNVHPRGWAKGGYLVKKKILVADDDTAIAELLTQALAEEGYDSYKESQSLRFYDAVKEHRPDLILLDLMMPYLEGDDELELLRMHEDTAKIPVIVITAKSEAKEHEDEYRAKGVVTVITKPFDLNHLMQTIKNVLD